MNKLLTVLLTLALIATYLNYNKQKEIIDSLREKVELLEARNKQSINVKSYIEYKKDTTMKNDNTIK